MMVALVFAISWTIKLETIFSVNRRQYANEILILIPSVLYKTRQETLVNDSE